ncbi:hypothetical protein HHK36_027578 [Tetracentron sinense]|uniref:TH1 domain-containing protein n=1 Tax=Tetracentron sinense TaxID=13715 RepID=A0A835D170_TETSI|nr:hypothetical protein HHK36_027578 [Tetracentron sinense]
MNRRKEIRRSRLRNSETNKETQKSTKKGRHLRISIEDDTCAARGRRILLEILEFFQDPLRSHGKTLRLRNPRSAQKENKREGCRNEEQRRKEGKLRNSTLLPLVVTTEELGQSRDKTSFIIIISSALMHTEAKPLIGRSFCGPHLTILKTEKNIEGSAMDKFKSNRRVQIEAPQFDRYDGDDVSETLAKPNGRGFRLKPSENVTEDQEPFMGFKVRRKASLHRDYRGDYLDIPSQPYLMKILERQGDKRVLFADKVLKFTGSGKMKRRILLITDFAIYIVDPESDALKRRIALAAVDKLCLSELSDNFFAIIIPTEYDCLMACARKSEIVTVLIEATKSTSDYELEVVFSNRYLTVAIINNCVSVLHSPLFFINDHMTCVVEDLRTVCYSFEYNAAANLVKEIQFEEVEGS